jgi:hypothetical protein
MEKIGFFVVVMCIVGLVAGANDCPGAPNQAVGFKKVNEDHVIVM